MLLRPGVARLEYVARCLMAGVPARPLMVGLADATGRPRYTNAAARAFAGMWRDPCPWTRVVHPDDVGVLRRLLAQPRAAELSLRVQRRDGEYRRLMVRLIPCVGRRRFRGFLWAAVENQENQIVSEA